MGKIGCGYGSEWHLLRYLGYHRHELSEKILALTGAQSLSWLDFGFTHLNKRFERDREHNGLNFINNHQARANWRSFWPASGMSQNWDAVGKINYGDHQEWLLVEAKAHLNELKSNCKATNQNSINKINTALTRTINHFCDTPVPVENWLTPYYQYANRLAVLYFLMKECSRPIPARLLLIYFCGDQRPDAVCPQTPEEWRPAVRDMYTRLNMNTQSELYERVHHLFLYVNPKA